MTKSVSAPYCQHCREPMTRHAGGLWGCSTCPVDEASAEQPRTERRTESVRILVTKTEMREIQSVVPKGGLSSYGRQAIMEKVRRAIESRQKLMEVGS